MSNRLSMAKINSIETLHQSGHSNRTIAQILGVDRGAVNRYVRSPQGPAGAKAAKHANRLRLEKADEIRRLTTTITAELVAFNPQTDT